MHSITIPTKKIVRFASRFKGQDKQLEEENLKRAEKNHINQ